MFEERMEMKKISTICMLSLVLGLVSCPAFAIEYCKDFLEPGNPGGWNGNSLKTFDDEWTMEVGDEVELDIWVNDVPFSLLSGGFWIEYDPSQVGIVSVDAYDGFNGPPGPWEVAFTQKIPDAGGPGTYMVIVSPPLIPASPDGDGDLIIGKIRFHCESEGDAIITISTIPGFDTFVADTIVFDHDMFPNEIVIHQEIDYCEGDFDNDGDQDGTDAAVFKSDFGRSPFNKQCPTVITTTITPFSTCDTPENCQQYDGNCCCTNGTIQMCQHYSDCSQWGSCVTTTVPPDGECNESEGCGEGYCCGQTLTESLFRCRPISDDVFCLCNSGTDCEYSTENTCCCETCPEVTGSICVLPGACVIGCESTCLP